MTLIFNTVMSGHFLLLLNDRVVIEMQNSNLLSNCDGDFGKVRSWGFSRSERRHYRLNTLLPLSNRFT